MDTRQQQANAAMSVQHCLAGLSDEQRPERDPFLDLLEVAHRALAGHSANGMDYSRVPF